MQSKFVKLLHTKKGEEFKANDYPRGICAWKKKEILKKLCPMMQNKNRIEFWKDLLVNNATDLINEH